MIYLTDPDEHGWQWLVVDGVRLERRRCSLSRKALHQQQQRRISDRDAVRKALLEVGVVEEFPSQSSSSIYFTVTCPSTGNKVRVRVATHDPDPGNDPVDIDLRYGEVRGARDLAQIVRQQIEAVSRTEVSSPAALRSRDAKEES